MKEIVTNLDVLREIALDQHGYVTMAQALDAGLTHPIVSTMLHRDRLQKVAHGVYRVPQVPITQYNHYMLAVLWTGAPEACLSHETALEAYNVSDIFPAKIHVTVAKGRRIKRAGGEKYVLHRDDINQEQITWWEQIPIVRLPLAIEQCIASGVPTYLIRQALERAPRRGLLLPKEVDRLTDLLEVRNG